MGTYQVSGAVTKILPVSMLTDGKKLEFIPVSYLTRCSPYAEVLALRGLSLPNGSKLVPGVGNSGLNQFFHLFLSFPVVLHAHKRSQIWW